jgi:hypothetical protein
VAAPFETHDRRETSEAIRLIAIPGRDEGIAVEQVLGQEPLGSTGTEEVHMDVGRGRELRTGRGLHGLELVSTVPVRAHPAKETGVVRVVGSVVEPLASVWNRNSVMPGAGVRPSGSKTVPEMTRRSPGSDVGAIVAIVETEAGSLQDPQGIRP